MMEEDSVYACAVLMCFDELRADFNSKKEQLQRKYPNNNDRVLRAMRRFAYQLPNLPWDVESESVVLTYIESFLSINKSEIDFNSLVWSNGLDWDSVCELFQKKQPNIYQGSLKTFYRSKITSMLGDLSQKNAFFSERLIYFCTKHSFLSNAQRMSFRISPLSFDLEREDFVYLDQATEAKLAHLFFYWDNGFLTAIKTQFFSTELPHFAELAVCSNYILNLSGLSLSDADRELLLVEYYQSFPAHKNAVSRRDEVLLLNYFISNAKPNAIICVLVSSSFLNRLGVDQSYREYLLARKYVHAVVALPEYDLHIGGESPYLLVLKGSENKEVTFVDARRAYLKTEHGNVLDVTAMKSLFGDKSDKSALCKYADVEAKQSRLEPSVYLLSQSNQLSVQWEDIEQLELKIGHLSKAIVRKLHGDVNPSKSQKKILAEDVMSQVLVGSIAVFDQLPSGELKKLSKRILGALPKMEALAFVEFLDDAVYTVSDRFNLNLDFDVLDDLAENIAKKKSQFLV